MPRVAAAAADARAAVDRLLTSRVLRRQSAEVSVEAGLRSARASAALDGVDIPLDELRTEGSADPVIQGALRVSAQLGGLRDTFIRAPRQVLARLHVLAAADLTTAGAARAPAGRGRLGRGRPPARGAGGAARAADESARRRRRRGGAWRAARAAPFERRQRASWRAARPGSSCSRAGSIPRRSPHPTSATSSCATSTRAPLQGYATGGADGLAAWVPHCCHAIELGARDSLAICEALARG